VSQQDALLLAPREPAYPGVGEPLRSHRRHHLLHPLAAPGGGERDPQPVTVETEGYEVPAAHGQVWVQHDLLGHIANRASSPALAAGGADLAARPLQTEDDAKEGRLAGSVGAYEGGELAGGHGERHRLQHPPAPQVHGDVVHFQYGRRAGCGHSRGVDVRATTAFSMASVSAIIHVW
jgi:hypothetical protein